MSATQASQKRKLSFADTISAIEAQETQHAEPTENERTEIVQMAKKHVDAYLNDVFDYAAKYGLDVICQAISEMVQHRLDTLDQPTGQDVLNTTPAVSKQTVNEPPVEEEAQFEAIMNTPSITTKRAKVISSGGTPAKARAVPAASTPGSGGSTYKLRSGYKRKT